MDDEAFFKLVNTTEQIFSKLNEVDKSVAVLTEHVKNQNKRVEKSENKSKDLDKRIVKIEQKYWFAVGGLTVLFIVVEFVFNFVL